MNKDQIPSRKYFGQKGDDFVIWSLFSDGFKGYFVDVGAFDGIHLSNTYSFELAGWTGVCVEANPDYFPLLEKNRPASRTIHAACVSDTSQARVEFLSEPLGLLSGIEAYKTQNMEKRYAARGMSFPGWTRILVPGKTLTQILEDAGAPRNISFLSIDVEGTERDVLLGLDFSKFSFRLIVAESNSAKDKSAIDSLLAEHGYFASRKLGANTFYVQSIEDSDCLTAVSGTIKIEDTLHPLGEKATRVETRGRNIVI
ncbi:MAG: FkbM family methyltransferase [Opitutales bacterium]|nr:FkbM family methyltransferase [Opitutales bacterium]MCH8539399.1 FkbM family methyltransferase [Opitutales bacterium]